MNCSKCKGAGGTRINGGWIRCSDCGGSGQKLSFETTAGRVAS
jgi:ribosomal protein L37AE/L43A